MSKRVIVIGAGIAGLTTARAMALKGYRVTVIERGGFASGASIRNFGMLWPIGQPEGIQYETALRSKSIWKEVCNDAGIWFDEVGSMHMAYADDEWEVMNEFVDQTGHDRPHRLLNTDETILFSDAVVTNGLRGALWSPDEVIIDSRKAIARLPIWLQEKYNVEFIWGKAVTAIQYPVVRMGNIALQADLIVVCSGADFETLYPELFETAPITRCKLQMMRMIAQPDNYRIGPALCGALSMVHYKGFAAAPSLPELRKRFQRDQPAYLQYGIHVMVSQNEAGELTVGDSHEYGLKPDPFDKQEINALILDYLKTFARFRNEQIIETWHGVYPKLTNDDDYLVLTPEEGVTIFNGLGGAGMTMSFGIAERVTAGL